MDTALALAPENRFILRSAARLYLHIGEGRRAHRILLEADALLHDPWILSAEVAIAAVMGKSSKHIKRARKILEAERFKPIHLSELASAIGTVEARAGNRKRSRQFVERSL